MRLTRLFRDFFENEKASGIVLMVCTAVSLLLSNSGVADAYLHFWETPLKDHTLTHWINDGLMTVFFLMIGLELEREIYQGELSNAKDALLPLVAALGGMLLPAGAYLLFNTGLPTANGAGIPMATDIAFAMAVLSLLGRRVPVGLKVFLTALAVTDDLGAILLIAVAYTKTISWMQLGIALGIFTMLLVLNRMRIHHLALYLIGGAGMWYFMLHSGIHATITGVLLAFAIPFGDGSEESISYRLQHFLHRPVSFFILPLFALANTAIPVSGSIATLLHEPYTKGIFWGLLLGKPAGILLFCFIVYKLGLATLPTGVGWRALLGAGLLAGIGFTMSIFVTLLAFEDAKHINQAKLTILLSSVIAAALGYMVLKMALSPIDLSEAEVDASP